MVDEINDTEEIVVKPLSKQLKSVSCFAGATIMGDGRVALILDVLGLAQMTRVVSQLHEHGVAKARSRRGRRVQPGVMAAVPCGKPGRMAIRSRWCRDWKSSKRRRWSVLPDMK